MLRRVLPLAICTAVVLPAWCLAAASPSELRGLWVVRTGLTSPEAVDRVVDQAAEAGFNALFVQVSGRGDAFYRSAVMPRSPLLDRQPRDFDPLARLLARARSRGIEVHAWLNVLLAASFSQPLPRGHVLARHPEWVMVPRAAAAVSLAASPARRLQLVRESARGNGDVEGYYLSPSVPGVGAYLEAVVGELVRAYPVDGVHFDFMRYPGPEFDYAIEPLRAFRRRVGGALLEAPLRESAAWDEYRRQVLTSLAARLARAARAGRPGIAVSAAVTPDEAQAVSQRFQDWPAWLREGILSALCPMTYTSDSRLFQQLLADVRRRMNGRRLWAGIGAFRLEPADLIEKIELARRTGVQGVVLFSQESLDPALVRRLREQAFPPGAAVGREAGPAPVPGSR